MVETFYSQFWANLLSSFIIAGIFSIVIIRSIDHYRRPKLKLVWTKETNHDFDWITLNIRNDGHSTLKEREINWHLYIPQDINFEFLEDQKYKAEMAGDSEIEGQQFIHYRDFNIFSSFPEREITILKLKLPNIRGVRFPIYYLFSTAVGVQPRRVWRKGWYRRIARRNGDPILKILPHIEVDYT